MQPSTSPKSCGTQWKIGAGAFLSSLFMSAPEAERHGALRLRLTLFALPFHLQELLPHHIHLPL